VENATPNDPLPANQRTQGPRDTFDFGQLRHRGEFSAGQAASAGGACESFLRLRR
jgi:hypothetical protein